MPPVSWGVSPALEAAARLLRYASQASVSCGVSLALEAAARFVWYASVAAVSCGVSVAPRWTIFVAAGDTLPMVTLFFGWHVAKSDSDSMSKSVRWREYRCVRMECVEIAKIEMSGRCNHAGVDTHTREWAETTKYVQKVTEEGPM
jgi:hypothetical protein